MKPANQPRRLGRVLELVLRLVEDQPELAFLPAQFLQRVAVVVEQRVAVLLQQARPFIAGRHQAGLAVGRPAGLVDHFQTTCRRVDVLRRRLISREARCYAEAKQQIGELLNVVAVAHAIVAQDVAVGPEFLDDGGGIHSGFFL